MLRGTLNIPFIDALHLATAAEAGCDAVIRWKGAGSTPALTSTDVLPVGLAWANSACYRVRAVSTAGAVGPWSPRECTA